MLVRGSSYFARAYAWRFTGSVLFCAFSLVAGGIALALWLTQVDNSVVGGAGARASTCGPRWPSSAGRCEWPTR